MPRATRRQRLGRRLRGGSRRLQRGGAAAAQRRSKQPDPGPCQCHPSVGAVRPAHGCIPLDTLRAAAKRLRVPLHSNGAELRRRLEETLKVEPGAERSFCMSLPLPDAEKGDLARRALRPAYPQEWKKDPDMWLDSNNIAAVMNQYEDTYPKFEFMGPFPIDFAAPDPYQKRAAAVAAGGAAGGAATQPKCLMNEICELRVTKALANGTEAIGIVYNLDPHFKSGSHWVANYIDIPGHRCYYFDSYGMAPPPQVAKFMKWLTTQDPKMRLEYNSRRLQFRDTECGVYCLYVIIRMLMGDSFVQITRRRPNDADMLQFRKCLFSL
jgi:hypothetical protein